ncbi:hypothetical protein Pint_34701 [Pistacia integerrima]|uniref:Uncharacterized protein n=1 Tax=Pistacia integerrima TaxID=434235 RepID=A0ACC0X2G5_9ROSI|nr:hypothetical protein Pint_34701 [Pistacia integerrima]
MEKKSKVLIIGATGRLGFHLAKFSIENSHPTFVLIRDSSFCDPNKQDKIQSLSTAGATLLKGSLEDEKSLFEAVKQVDVVICSIPSKHVLDQKLLIRVLKQAGCIKVFNYRCYRTQISGMDNNFYSRRSEIRRLIEAEGIPYTYICCNLFMTYLLPCLVQPGLKTPPRDKVTIFGDGNTKGVFVKDVDVAAFTISALDDPHALNKVLYLRPVGNVYSMNELVETWESKIGKKLEKVYVPGEELLKKIEGILTILCRITVQDTLLLVSKQKFTYQETPYPDNMELIFIYSIFVKGDHTYFDIESSGGVDGTQLYPHLKYTTITPVNLTIVIALIRLPTLMVFVGIYTYKSCPLLGERNRNERFSEFETGISVMATKSKILLIGGTGYIGKFIVEASAKASHPTFVLVREATLSNPDKSKIIENFKSLGVNFITGDLYNHESLVNAIKQVDVVISTVGHALLGDQDKIIAAIKEAGNVKRFFPSEFGNDVDHVHAVEPAKTAFGIKANIRRTVEKEGIPYTYVANSFFSGYFLPSLAQPGATSPPRDKVVILGDGNPKAIFNKEDDIATYTIRAVDDPRTLNKVLYIRPPGNIYSFNDLVSLWEKKIGKTLERVYISEEQLLKNIQEAPVPVNVLLSINHSAFVKGDHTNFEIDPSFGVEATALYPDVKYTTVDEYLNQFV